MNDLNGTGKRGALAAHLETDKWFAIGDKLAEQPLPGTPNTRELATIAARRGRRAERIGIAAGLLALVVIALVSLVAHRRSAGGTPAVVLVAPPAAPAAVVAAMPAATPAPPVAAPAPPVAAPAPSVAAPAPAAAVTAPAVPPASVAHTKHKKRAHKAPASRHR